MKFAAQLLFAVILGALIITGLTARYLPPHHVIARVNALSDPNRARPRRVRQNLESPDLAAVPNHEALSAALEGSWAVEAVRAC